jgi:holliday junction DNA helicase RuvA
VIGRLVGEIVGQGDDGTVTIDVHGVGYEVTVPLGALGRALKDAAGNVTLHIHTVVREDAFLLYGFPSTDEREVFRILIGLSNVGPKIATSILSAMPPSELQSAIARRELGRLTSISGVGRKTAERLLLELKDKLGGLSLAGAAPPTNTKLPAPVATKQELLRSALTNMGFKPAEVDRAVEAVRDRVASTELADLVRDALASAAR